MKKAFIGLLLGMLLAQSVFGQTKNDFNTLIKANAFHVTEKLPVDSVSGLPWFWDNYDDTGKFETYSYKAIFSNITPDNFVLDLIKVNNTGKFDPTTGENRSTIHKFKIKGGSLYIAYDRYYLTVDEEGKLVSIFIEGEEDGFYPEAVRTHTGIRGTDDLLCFFQGERKGYCAVSDDT